MPASTIAALAVLAAAAMVAAGLAYQAGTPRAWNATAVFGVGGVLCGYGLLATLLGHDATLPLVAGVVIAALALAVLARVAA